MKRNTVEATKKQTQPTQSDHPTQPAPQPAPSTQSDGPTGNAQKAKAVAIQVGKFVLDNLDKIPQDPYGVLNVVFGVTGVIYAQVKLVQANKEQFTSLSERIAMIESMIRGLDKIPNTERYKAALDKFRTCVNDCLSFIKEFSGKKWYTKIFFAGAYKDKFEELNSDLKEVMGLLDFGMQVQSVFNHEQDKKDQEKDKADLMARMDEIVKLQQASMAQLQKLDLDGEERQKVVLAQLESLKQQVQAVVAIRSEEKTKKDEIDQKFVIPFYDLAIDGMLKKGSFATIYLGKWCEQQVAIKKLEGAISPSERQQFIREVEIMSKLRSPFIVQFQGACLEENRLALVMEYMELGSLSEMLSKKKLTLEEQKQLALDIAKGLLFLHKQGIIHRDLKSANILINSAGRAKITDFGLSKIKSRSVATICERSSAFEWMAPEILEKGEAYTPKSDMYAYGVILWEIVTGKKPYAGLSEKEIYERTLSGRRLEELKGIPEVYANLIRRCWSPNVQDRPELTEIIRVIEQYNPEQLKAEDLYLQGQGYEGKKDYVHAKQAYERAAQIGFAKAYTSLGLFCLTGKAGGTDKRRAFEFMLQGAEGGHVRAQFNLAQMLEYGDGVDKDLLKAYEWYKKAAAQGFEEAKKRLDHIEEKIREQHIKRNP